MKQFILLAASLAIATGAQAHEPTPPPAKTLKCQVTYAFPNGNDSVDVDKLPAIAVKAVRLVDAPRLVAKAEQTTTDGRYTVKVSSLQPIVPADYTKFEQVSIEVTDHKTNTITSVGSPIVTQARQNIDHQEVLVSPDFDANKLGVSLDVACDLQ